jgi:large subunit ribosomal protein L31
MKDKIHPTYYEGLKITCACGNVILAGSTKKELKTEICSACHPFYTGQQKLIDTTGRVDKFLAKVKKAQKIQEKKVKVVDEEMDELIHETEEKEPVQTGFLTEEAAPAIKKAVKAKAAKKAATKKPAAPTKKVAK